MLKRLWVFIVIVFLARSAPLKAESPSSLSSVEISIGMVRSELEKKVSVALNKPHVYSPYGKNLSGGQVDYEDSRTILRVVYEAGSPAPRVKLSDGTSQHFPPKEEIVKSFELIRKNTPSTPEDGRNIKAIRECSTGEIIALRTNLESSGSKWSEERNAQLQQLFACSDATILQEVHKINGDGTPASSHVSYCFKALGFGVSYSYLKTISIIPVCR